MFLKSGNTGVNCMGGMPLETSYAVILSAAFCGMALAQLRWLLHFLISRARSPEV